MKSVTWLWKTVGFLALTLVIAACGGATEVATEPAEPELPVVKLHAMEGGTSASAIRIIEAQGFDKANGFQGEFYEVGGDASVQFMLQGNSDVSFDCDLVTPALLRTQGFDISTFYPLVTQDAEMVVRGDSSYTTPEDLIGQPVGHDGLESGTMTTAQIMLDAFHDIQIEEDYDLQFTEEAALIRLLARGDLEAIYLGQPEILISHINNGTKSAWGPAYQEWVDERGGRIWNITLCAYEEWLVENPDLARAVMAAWDDALAWINEDPSRLTEAPFPELFGIENPEVLEAFADLVATSEYFTNSWTEDDIKAGRDFLQLAAEIGTIIQEVPENSVVSLDELLGQ
jgi:NitT/TauT family transport system substrate-binding protein